MSTLVQPVTESSTIASSTSTSSSSSSNTLDKDTFLQLLVTQMQYQDPLNPNTDTEFVAQLATFSQLEQLQNLNQVASNSQAFGMVGMDVVVSSKDSSGNTTYTSGTVDYVVMSDGEAKLSIDGKLYSMDQLYEVISSEYLLEQGLPSVNEKVEETFDKANPEDITFEVNLGSGDTVASEVAIIIDGEVIDSDYVTLEGDEVTISKDALSDLEEGTYNVIIVFNDSLYTTVTDKISITVEDTSSDDDSDTDTGADTDETGADSMDA